MNDAEPAAMPDTTNDVMVDLETLGTLPGAPILAIGAVRFDINDIGIRATNEHMFYQAITLESCLELGMRPSASTIEWWMKQDDQARLVFCDGQAIALPMALDLFTDWLNSRPDNIWGNSARFDMGLLEAAYRICGKELPWAFFRERCYRTVKNMPCAADVKLDRLGTHHNALDDAISQAAHLQHIYKHIKL